MIGKIIYINGLEVQGGDNLNYSYDLDNISSTGTVDMPFDAGYKDIEKFTTIQIYVGEVDSTTYTKDDLILVWDGYLMDIGMIDSKTNASVSLEFADQMQFFNINQPIRPSIAGLLTEFVNVLKQSYSESDITIPFDITVNAFENVIVKPRKEKNTIQQLESIREKTVVYIDYVPWSNEMIIKTPQFIQYVENGTTEAWQFDDSNIVKDLKMNSSTNMVTTVVYVGLGGRKGVAIDFLALSQGRQFKEERYYAGWSANIQELEKLAREKLLERARNNIVEFSTIITNDTLKMRPGDLIQISNTKFFSGEVFIVKNLNYSISKQGDAVLNISAYASILATLPEDFIMKDYNITDIDTVREQPDKVTEAVAEVYGYNEG